MIEETVEMLCLPGQEDRIVGVSQERPVDFWWSVQKRLHPPVDPGVELENLPLDLSQPKAPCNQ